MHYQALHHWYVMKKENSVIAEHLELQWWCSAAVAFYVKCDTQRLRDLYFKIHYLWDTVPRPAFLFHPMHNVQNNIKPTKSRTYYITKVSLESTKFHHIGIPWEQFILIYYESLRNLVTESCISCISYEMKFNTNK